MFEAISMEEIEKRFHEVNKSKPLPNWKKDLSRTVILEAVKMHLLRKYKDHIKKTSKPQFPNIHRDKIIEHLETLQEFRKINNTDDYIKKIEDINTDLKMIYPDKAMKANLKQGMMLGLLLNKPKKNIPSAMRNKVWRRYNNSSLIGNCTICHKPIDRDNDNWHCAHIVSEFRGGATALDNMIPSCPDCNLMMGTQNANEYSNLKYHRDLPKPIITPPQQPHFITLDINSSASS